jgi:glycosyltransferase involved in cell wall biosynthesis
MLERYPDKPVFLCENGLDLYRYQIPRRKMSRDRFVVVWQGGSGHHGAWTMLAPQLTEFMYDFQDAVLLIVGQPPADGTIPEDLFYRCQHVPWAEDMHSYVGWVSRGHVGLAPSLDTPFYHAKSPLRLYEYQACRVPALVSATTYGEHVMDGTTGLVVPDDGWYAALSRLYDDRKLRAGLREAGYAHLQETASIQQRRSQWLAAITSD